MAVVAVTGADGFIGVHLCAFFESRGLRTIRVVRRNDGRGECRRVVPDVTSEGHLAIALEGVDVVVHLAARAHILRERRDADSSSAFQKINVDGTKALCMAAHRAGVRRIVFLSSIGVNGARTDGKPFDEQDPPRPVEPYAVSKWQAEQLLQAKARELDLEVVIVRPPLVYGPEVKGNFLRLLNLAASGVPLPLASITNRRNLIGVQNLCDLLRLCVESASAAGQLFLAAEQEAHSTPEIIRALCRGLGRPCRLFAVPEALVRGAARVMGVGSQFEKLCGSLEICPDKAYRDLGWRPRVSFDEEIGRTAEWYLRNRRAFA
ncbi:MAG TPA: NAD-dependent epimerase/dehydratase family protein [Steroidobacter sp.]